MRSVDEVFVIDTIHAADHRAYAGGQFINDTRGRCLSCGALLESSYPRQMSIALNHLGRSGFAEYLWNSHTLGVFREDVTRLWETQGFTGFHLRSVKIVGWYNKSDKPLPLGMPRYRWMLPMSKVQLAVPRAKTTACKKCGFIKYAFPQVDAHQRNGISIDRTTWDGSDVFSTVGYGFTFCTRRVVEATLLAGYNRRIAFVRSQDWCKWAEFDWRKWNAASYKKYQEGFLIRHTRDL